MDRREQALQGWVESFKYGRYRNYPAFLPEKAQQVLMDSVLEEGPEVRKLWLGDEADPCSQIFPVGASSHGLH